MFSKFIYFILYTLAVTVFINYVKLSYYFNVYYDLFFCNFKNKSKFDYIIVGGGSAGSIVATKLSNAGEKILLVEAGSVPAYFFDIPVMAPILLNTPYDWRYVTVSQKNACKGFNNNQSYWSSGKILGGSSRLNYLIYSIGHRRDYDYWFEDFQEPVIDKGGSLHVDYNGYGSKITEAVLKGVEELTDYIKNTSFTGFIKTPLLIKNGERWSTDRVMYNSLNKNLKILTNSFVTKIIFNSNKAIGIQFFKGYNNYTVFAKKGVVVSAGAIGTPKLLMLSGIGPKQHLKDHKIKNIADLPVGQNLIDHIMTGLDLVTVKSNTAMSIADILNPLSLIKYYFYGKGPWTTSAADVIGTFHSKFVNDTSSVPDLQIITLSAGISQDNGILLGKNLGISNKVMNEYFVPLAYNTTISIAPVLLHPESNGEIKLKSSNPFDPPVIDPKYLTSEKDILTLIEGLKFVKKLIKTKSMKEFDARLNKKPLPGCERINFDTTDYWRCYVQHMTFSVYHPAGTCKMGSVVDSKFRVYKTKNLFVVDASVFPRLPSGNTHGPVVMLAEKASKLLIERTKNYKKKLYKCDKKDIFLLKK